MNAETISIGSELLTPEKLDTNSLYLTERLNELGIHVHLKTVVGDDEPMLERVIRDALRRSDMILSIGGLGPTEDDLTRNVFSKALGRRLLLDERILQGLKQRFAARGIEMPEINARQAYVLEGSTVLENRFGTAPGLWLEHEGNHIVLLPGPPRELKPMFDAEVFPKLRAVSGGKRVIRHVLKIAGLTESKADSLAAPVYTRYKDIQTTILASPGHVELHLSCTATDLEAAERRLEELENELAASLGNHLYSRQNESLEEVVGSGLSRLRATLAVAESCTGGLIAERITRVPGSSAYFLGSMVCYSNEAKVQLGQVPFELIRQKGAVSAEVAERLAENIRRLYNASIGLGVVGIAGPGGGTPEKPVGLVFVALAREGNVFHKRYEFPGDRDVIRFLASQAALDLVRRELTST